VNRWVSKPWLGIAAGCGVALLYSMGTQVLFRAGGASGLTAVMSVGFLFLVPLAAGALTVALAPEAEGQSAPYAVFAPWLACLALGGLTVLLAMDAAICVVMAMPLLFLMSSLGGLVAWAVRRSARGSGGGQGVSGGRPETFALALVVLGPYLVTPLEQQALAPDSWRTVRTAVVISAPRETVWRNVVRVPYITDAEQRGSVFYALGLPRPREALLSAEGTGGLRTARFDSGLTFLERVTSWEEGQTLGFSIEIDRTAPMPPPLAAVGGRYFDILDGEFRLSPQADGSVLLELTSRQRVSTRFDPYAGLWTDWIMRDLQQNILAVIEARAEAGA
jgi:hypothetical protein